MQHRPLPSCLGLPGHPGSYDLKSVAAPCSARVTKTRALSLTVLGCRRPHMPASQSLYDKLPGAHCAAQSRREGWRCPSEQRCSFPRGPTPAAKGASGQRWPGHVGQLLCVWILTGSLAWPGPEAMQLETRSVIVTYRESTRPLSPGASAPRQPKSWSTSTPSHPSLLK